MNPTLTPGSQTKNEIKPQPLGLLKSFGFGDRLGKATPGHLASANKYDFYPIFAQQSIREMTRTQRTPQEVMTAAVTALAQSDYKGKWGADADHLKTPEDVQSTTQAGFTFFTIDPSAFVNQEVDRMDGNTLEKTALDIESKGIFSSGNYLSKTFSVGQSQLTFSKETLAKAAVKYGLAIDHSEKMSREILKLKPGADIEISVDETDLPTSPLEHLFVGLELKRRKIPITSLAPRFIGEFEKGIDYKGDLVEFEKQLKLHVEIAKQCGPYKISVHSGSDKFSAYPAIGRVCGNLLHVKTAGTSYLEALRTVCRVDSSLFAEIAAYCHSRFQEDRASYHISTTSQEVESLRSLSPSDYEEHYLNLRPGRQLLHVTFGSVLTQGKRSNQQSFKEAILELLDQNEALHDELLEKHFDRHLKPLTQG